MAKTMKIIIYSLRSVTLPFEGAALYLLKHIFTLQECWTAFNTGSLYFLKGLESQLCNKYFNVMSRVSLFQKTTLTVLSRK